jgi:hypothetical protein
MGQPERNRHNETARTGQTEQDYHYRTDRTGLPGQNSRDWKAGTEQPGPIVLIETIGHADHR